MGEVGGVGMEVIRVAADSLFSCGQREENEAFGG